jgi:hypothetical protein
VDLQAATKSTHNLTETLNLWSHHCYHLDVDATDLLITELLQAVYTVSKIGFVQHALAAGSKTQTITLCALIESLCVQAPPATTPSPQPCPVPPMPHLTLPAFVAQSRRPFLRALTSAPYPPTLSHLQQQQLLLLPSPSPLPPRRGRVPLLLRQGLSKWPSPSCLHPLLLSFTPNRWCLVLLLLPPPTQRRQRPVANDPPPMAPLIRRLWLSLPCPPTGPISRWLVC